MTFEEMVKTYGLADRIAYYSSDIEAISNAINAIRFDLGMEDQSETEERLRVVNLALCSLINSLNQESHHLMEGEVKDK